MQECVVVDVQECARLPPCLTRLDVSYIGTPIARCSLERLFASLPALEFIRMHFRTADPEGLEYSTDSDDEQQTDERTLLGDFPLSLLRWDLPPRSCYTPCKCVASITESLLSRGHVICDWLADVPPAEMAGGSCCHPEPGSYRCTRLTHLDISMHELDTCEEDGLSVDGLPEGITALQRLQHLRLGNCMTAPLTHGISRLTQLTCLEIVHHEQYELGYMPDDLLVG